MKKKLMISLCVLQASGFLFADTAQQYQDSIRRNQQYNQNVIDLETKHHEQLRIEEGRIDQQLQQEQIQESEMQQKSMQDEYERQLEEQQ